MGPDFLDRLELSDEEREKLRGLGAGSAAALLAMRNASPGGFEKLLGRKRAERIAASLYETLTDEERRRLAIPVYQKLSTGARIDSPPPPLPKPPYDVASRDRLFAQLEELRRIPTRTPEAARRIAALEQELERLMKGG